jgi:competence ComEA-like helix-hairpin-helix protein
MNRLIKISLLFIAFGFVLGMTAPGWAAEHDGKININTATVEELTSLKGIGESLAQRIIDYREKSGPFENADDLLNVKGIGPKILSDNLDRITVGDRAEAAEDETEKG